MTTGISSYVKYMSYEQIGHVFKEHKIRFTQPLELNDPLEFNPILAGYSSDLYKSYVIDGVTMPSSIGWDRLNLIHVKLDHYGVLSLSKTFDSFYMWSHYAAGHKGFLLELSQDFNQHPAFKSIDGKVYAVKAVTYCNKYEIDLRDIDNGTGYITHERFDNEVFYKKTKRWESENEYRLIRRLQDLPPPTDTPQNTPRIYLGDLPLETITSVTFGALMSAKNKIDIVKACEGTKINFFQSMIHPEQPDDEGMYGKIHISSLNDKTVLEKVLNLNMSPAFIVEDNDIASSEKANSIENISQLPYYQGNEERVEKIFANRRYDNHN